jgi:hypothetical protein
MLSFVPLCRHLDLDPDDPVVELLESSDLLVHIGAKLIRQIAMSGFDDNIHVYLHRGVGSSNDALRRACVRRSVPTVGSAARSVQK